MVEEKALHFVTALLDVYRDEYNRGLGAFTALKFSNDVTGDFTTMLLAVHHLFQEITGDDRDLIDFTHALNKLAVQYIMDGDR